MPPERQLESIRIQGYRPFKDFDASFGPLEVIVGANAAGKSSLFEFLRFLRNGMRQRIPPAIVPGSVGQRPFHVPSDETIRWQASVLPDAEARCTYSGEVMGPAGRPCVVFERVEVDNEYAPVPQYGARVLHAERGQGFATDLGGDGRQDIAMDRPDQLALGTMNNRSLPTLYGLREYISNWRFYSAFKIASDKVRRPVPIEQAPVLKEDAGNLSSVLFYLKTEYVPIFEELEHHLCTLVPGFTGLTVRARGGPGEAIAFWEEEGVDSGLTIADLSDGVLRLLCWLVLCLHPKPSPLICIDEPDQGVHPRTLPVLAGLFEKACERTQFLLATHASYFLTQFDISRIAVMKKEDGDVKYLKPADSEALKANLEDFGPEEIEAMHRSDEMEHLV